MEEQKIKKIPMPVMAVIAVVLIAIIVAIIVTISRSNGLRAIVLRIIRTEGTVNLYDDQGTEVSILENMRLHDGNKMKTAKDSNVQMSLDELKLITLVEKSEVSFRKQGKALCLDVSDGAIYVNVKEKLAEGETFEIETSTMMAGIRGTSLFIDSDKGELYVTDGVVSLTVKDSETGEYTAKEKKIKAGHKASVTVMQDPKTGKMVTDLKVNTFSLEELPEAALKAIQGDTELIGRIAKATGWEKSDITDKAAAAAKGKTAEENTAAKPSDGKTTESGEEKAAADEAERKAKLAAELVGVGTGEIITFGHYEQDNDLTNGAEPIDWVVLDRKDGKVLVLSCYALDCKPFNDKWTKITWKTCTLRNWLNNSFYKTAFDEIEKGKIVQVTNVNPDSYEFFQSDYAKNIWSEVDVSRLGAKGGDDTLDNVFLLSWEEAWTYFASDDARQCSPTAYAIAQGPQIPSERGKSDDRWCWLLRSPGAYTYYDLIVDFDGALYSDGYEHPERGVRPALWITE